jgi:hypothetical protein
METFVSIFAPVFGGSLLVFMLISAHVYRPGHALWGNVYARNCHGKHVAWKVLAWALIGVACYLGYQAWLGMKAGDMATMPAIGLCMALAFCSFAGFNFSYADTE